MIGGFVVNTYDALNYDIDFPCVSKHDKRLENIIVNEYSYKNMDDLTVNIKSYTYRCRLNGIEINSKTYNRKQIKHYSYEIKKMIDRYDGQILLTIRGCDIFNRLLIDMYISPEKINLCQFLLDQSLQDKMTPFVKYNTYNQKKYK